MKKAKEGIHCCFELTVLIKQIVWSLAEMELIFPIAALIVLCSVLVARKVLITHQCFGYC